MLLTSVVSVNLLIGPLTWLPQTIHSISYPANERGKKRQNKPLSASSRKTAVFGGLEGSREVLLY